MRFGYLTLSEKEKDLCAEHTPIDRVTQKQILSRKRIVKPFEDANQVVNVPVNVANNPNVHWNRKQRRFFFEHCPDHLAKLNDPSNFGNVSDGNGSPLSIFRDF
jgi:hypothetical protein